MGISCATKGRPLAITRQPFVELSRRLAGLGASHDCRAAFQTAGAQCQFTHSCALLNHKLPRGDAHATYFRPTLGEKATAAAEVVQWHLLYVPPVSTVSRQVQVAGGSAPADVAHARDSD